ncbi:alpha-L-fucosidase, partial [Paenibacillus sp. Y412MC10]|uniref:alpha-L-fucosidase n=1 Tax=Geobacillus sp. (strain Y412MC10) TaxID=481743 RepID=UPI0037C5F53C
MAFWHSADAWRQFRWNRSRKDEVWKWRDAVMGKLVEMVRKGGKVVVNVGARERGIIGEKSVVGVEEVGEWLGG